MFPGDANNDGRVNHVDVLALGLNIGKEGPQRQPPFQNITWGPKQFPPWADNLPSTPTNAGFSDCDGNGVVDGEDVLALKLNYDSMQNAAVPPPIPYVPGLCPSCPVPRLIFTFDKDTATISDTLRIQIFYEHPDGVPPPLAPLGVAFTLEFNETLVKDSLTRIFFDDDAPDLLFAAGATGFADARAVPPGKVEFGAAGKGAPLLFSRPLGLVEIIIEDMIIRADTFWTTLKLDVTGLLAVNMLGESMPVEAVVDEVALFELIRVQEQAGMLPVRCYPSPVEDRMFVESPESPLTSIEIYNAAGIRIASLKPEGTSPFEIRTEGWLPGVYILKLLARDGRQAVLRVLKRRY